MKNYLTDVVPYICIILSIPFFHSVKEVFRGNKTYRNIFDSNITKISFLFFILYLIILVGF